MLICRHDISSGVASKVCVALGIINTEQTSSNVLSVRIAKTRRILGRQLVEPVGFPSLLCVRGRNSSLPIDPYCSRNDSPCSAVKCASSFTNSRRRFFFAMLEKSLHQLWSMFASIFGDVITTVGGWSLYGRFLNFPSSATSFRRLCFCFPIE